MFSSSVRKTDCACAVAAGQAARAARRSAIRFIPTGFMPDGFMPKYKRQARLWLPADVVANRYPEQRVPRRFADLDGEKGARVPKRNGSATKTPNVVKS